MESRMSEYCKVTVSLPRSLVEYADGEAARTSRSRSEVISQAIALAKTMQRDELAARGYALYSQESEEFADATRHWASDWLEAEDWDDAGQAR